MNRILIIIPIYNEEKYLAQSLQSFKNQSYKDIDIVLVNDGSTDSSLKIMEDYVNDDTTIINIKNEGTHQPGGKIINTFYQGLNSKDLNNYDFIGKFDSDIILPKNYFEVLMNYCNKDNNIGLIGGLLYIKKNEKWIYEGNSNKNHVRGPIKLYKKECFLEMNGLRVCIGWDNLDSYLLKSKKWKEITIHNLKVKLLKEGGASYNINKGEYLGKYFYFLGLNRFFAYLSALKEGIKKKSMKLLFLIIKSYESCRSQNLPLKINKEERHMINKTRMEELKSKLLT